MCCHFWSGKLKFALRRSNSKDAGNCSETTGRECKTDIGGGLRVLGILSSTPNPALKSFGITVDQKMVVVPARKLEPLTIQYRNNKKVVPNKASWNLMKAQFCIPAEVKSWNVILLFRNDGDINKVGDAVRKLTGQFKQLGIRHVQPKSAAGFSIRSPKPLNDCDDDDIDKALTEHLKKAANEGVQILLVVLPSKSKKIYNRVKFLADIKYGVHTICVLKEKIGKGAAFWANIALKFNAKLGGVNHTIPSQDLGFLWKEASMVLGIGVAHPSVDSIDGAPSIAAVVGSVDQNFAHWPASLQTNPSKEEMVLRLADMVEERLRAFWKRNKVLPKNILIYRDGKSSNTQNYFGCLLSQGCLKDSTRSC